LLFSDIVLMFILDSHFYQKTEHYSTSGFLFNYKTAEMKKKTLILVSALVVVVTAALFFFLSQDKTADITFVTAKAHYGSIAKSVTATGTIQPLDTVSVGAQVSGVVRNIYVDFNDVVKKGQLLAKIDSSIIRAQMEQSMANLATAKSNQVFQESTFERQKYLFDRGIISKAEYDLSENNYHTAEAAVTNANAQLKIATRNLFYSNIYSPIDGVVLNRNVSEGQTIASSFNAPTLFVIAKDLTKMQVRAAVDEADIGGVKSGQKVSFTVDAFPDDIFKGVVKEVLLHPTVSANVVTYKTLINVQNTNLKLKPGMTANITIYTAKDDNALLIPSKSLNFKPDSTMKARFSIITVEREIPFSNENVNPKAISSKGNELMQNVYVWTKIGDTLKEKWISIGMNDDAYVKVIEGLSKDEEVVTNVVNDMNSDNVDNMQRSPFMPQISRRSSKSSTNK
jgi:HlyD family secretion protein